MRIARADMDRSRGAITGAADDYMLAKLVPAVETRKPRVDAGLTRLLRRLASTGIEQYLVPGGLGEQHGSSTELALRLGFVLKAANLLHASGWALADLPSVLLQDGAPWVDALSCILSQSRRSTRLAPERCRKSWRLAKVHDSVPA